MSTDEKDVLKKLDSELEAVEKRLSWWIRFRRRYLTGRMLVVGQGFEYYGVGKGWLLAGGWTKLTAWFGIKFPIAAAILHESWEYLVTFFEGAVAVVEHTA